MKNDLATIKKDLRASLNTKYQALLVEQTEARAWLETEHRTERAALRNDHTANTTEAYQALLAKQTEERDEVNVIHAKERAEARATKRGKVGIKKPLMKFATNGAVTLYRRPWTDNGSWFNLSLQVKVKGKGARMFHFGWNGARLSINPHVAILRSKYNPSILTWVQETCKARLS